MCVRVSQVRSDVADKIGAGGHQGYAAMGGLYTQARPLNTHLYGGLQEQALHIPVSTLFHFALSVSTHLFVSQQVQVLHMPVGKFC